MTDIAIGFIFIIFLCIVAALIFSRRPRRELTPTERLSYENERGRLMAQQEFNKRTWQPNWGRP